MVLGEGLVVDADVGLGGAADQARMLEGDAAAVVTATDPAQHQPQVPGRIGHAPDQGAGYRGRYLPQHRPGRIPGN